MEIPASAAKKFPELGAHDLLATGANYSFTGV
jgi:hypothetical protein